MNFELEDLWLAMKGTRYSQLLESIRKDIMAAETPQAAQQVALDRTVEAVRAVAGTLWFYDYFGDRLIRPSAVSGGGDLSNIVLRPGEGIAGQVIATGESTIIDDCQKDPRWAGRVDRKTGFQTQTMICVPLKWRESTFGSIQIINKTDRAAYDEKDLVFAQDIAACVAGAFEQRGLLDEYVKAFEEKSEPEPLPLSFEELILLEDADAVLDELDKTEIFPNLSDGAQKKVLRLIKKLQAIYFEN